MKKRNLLIINAAILIAIGLFFYTEKKPLIKTTNEVAPEKVEAKKIIPTTPKSPTKPIERSIASITENEIKSFRATFPDQFEVKTEVAQNPHKTPESLILFAETLGPLYEKALQDRKNATLLIGELGDCVSKETVAQTARAICLSNAEKLANIYPELREKVGKIQELAPVEIHNLIKKKM